MQQQIIQGIEKLPKILKRINCKRIFLIVGSSFRHQDIRLDVESLDVEKIFFSDYTSNPLYEQVCKGVDLLLKEQCDAIIAIGGGSPIDVAKCIKLAALAEEGKRSLIPPLVNTCVQILKDKLPIIAIPTTAGTGSESTHNAVIYFKGEKQTITNDGILPDYALLVPTVLNTLSLYQKKCTMMDALCQGIESWWSVNSTEESREYSRNTIKLIMQNWEKYIFENDSEASAKILLAANYSGRAINIAQTTAAHAMSYKITSLCNIPHGHAVAVCLPEIWEYMINNINKCVDIRGDKYLLEIFDSISKAMGGDNSNDTLIIYRKMLKKLELIYPKNSTQDIKTFSKSVNSIRLKNNPIKLEYENIFDIYSKIFIY